MFSRAKRTLVPLVSAGLISSLLSGCITTDKAVQIRIKKKKYTQKLITEDISNNYAPSPRAMHTAIWTGDGMLIWGGLLDEKVGIRVTGGGIYNPQKDTWRDIPTIFNHPFSLYHHSAKLWNSKFIVWGGIKGDMGHHTNFGAMLDLTTMEWTNLTRDNAPTPRSGHTAVIAQDSMIIWGGFSGADYLNDGAYFNLKEQTWEAIEEPPKEFPPRAYHTAIITEDSMIIWGGMNHNGPLNTGASYDFKTKTWNLLTNENAPIARSGHTAVWTEDQMIVWGGSGEDNRYLNSGAIYDPKNDAWIAITNKKSPRGRELHTAVWTGKEMIIWGGSGKKGLLKYGGIYNPQKDKWKKLKTKDKIQSRSMHSLVWTGSEMILWGGKTNKSRKFINGSNLGKMLRFKDNKNKPTFENQIQRDLLTHH